VLFAAFDRVSPGQFILVVILDAVLSMWIYWHASRHGSKHATAWGILTFLAVAPVLVVYFIHYFMTRRRF
jgi:hypothetical protein